MLMMVVMVMVVVVVVVVASGIQFGFWAESILDSGRNPFWILASSLDSGMMMMMIRVYVVPQWALT